MSNLESVAKRLREKRAEGSMYIKLEVGDELVGEFVDVGESTGTYGDRVDIKIKVSGMVKTFSRPATNPTYNLLNEMIMLEIVPGDPIRLKRKPDKDKGHVYKVENLARKVALGTASISTPPVDDTPDLEAIFKED